ncbi:MAG: penicillin-binding transpeptidase domain-containing protein [Thermodesulfobacteriota bacterium]
MKPFPAIAVTIVFSLLACGPNLRPTDDIAARAFAGRDGALVIIDCATGAVNDFRPAASGEKLPPCSTFKIWNTLIGLESGIISSPDQDFYRWDGVTRSLPDWDRDLTLKEAFRVSCVPAFQDLARRIGPDVMRSWLDRIGYGDRDMSAGVDCFWLPVRGRKTILISPLEQARLIDRLVSKKLPFGERSLAVLRDVMMVRKTDRGTLFGKTGSGADDSGKYTLGWFVGYIEAGGETHAFAGTVKGDNVMGKDARGVVESVFERQGLL